VTLRGGQLNQIYGVSGKSYLERALKRLASDEHENLFYAAFELRCGIESRLQQYLEAQEGISNAKKNEWQLRKLGRTIEEAFQTGDQIVEVEVSLADSGIVLGRFFYTPVTRKLLKAGERLGDLLHGLQSFRAPNDPWWITQRQWMSEIARDLDVACRGTLLGPPLWDRATREGHMTTEMIDSEIDEIRALGARAGSRIVLQVSYPPSLPS
jgi:hypothetical protein